LARQERRRGNEWWLCSTTWRESLPRSFLAFMPCFSTRRRGGRDSRVQRGAQLDDRIPRANGESGGTEVTAEPVGAVSDRAHSKTALQLHRKLVDSLTGHGRNRVHQRAGGNRRAGFSDSAGLF